MSPPGTVPGQHILQQAAEWFATLLHEDATEQDKAEWQAWFNQNPEHQRAWHYVERVGQRFQQAQRHAGQNGAGKILKSTRAERITRRRMLGGGLACLAAWLSWHHTPLPAVTQRMARNWTADHRTAIGETRQLALADGGHLWLNTASAVDIDYRKTLRRIHLRTGEILIQTAEDPQQRPFIVSTGQGNLRALGTRFTVLQRETDTLLAVYDGTVEITTSTGNQQRLNAGQQTLFDDRDIQPPQPAQQAREVWAKGLIVADNIPLRDLVAEFARYRRGHLGVDPAVADLIVMGTYPVDNPGHSLAMLENALPVRVNRLLPWWTTLEPRH